MTIHQQRLLVEIAEGRENPVLSCLDEKLSRYAANRLERRHGERLIRMVLGALADIENFPPADLLWNAGHPDVPLHCFFRLRREPVFRAWPGFQAPHHPAGDSFCAGSLRETFRGARSHAKLKFPVAGLAPPVLCVTLRP